MSRKAILAVVAGAIALVFVAVSAARPAAGFYWLSFEAEQAVEKSDWGDARGVRSVNCHGLGAYQKQYGSYKFKRFRCELEDRNYERIGFVTIYTTGPESWKPANFIRPRCR